MSNKKKKKKQVVIDNTIKYNDNTVIEDYASEDFIMYKSLEPIKDILIREKCKDRNIKFSKELALNLDKVEIEKKKKTPYMDNTVDLVIGLENKHLLLVEAKYDAQNMENIARDIHKKIKHSRELLVSNPKFVSLYNKKIILLHSEKIEENKRRLMSYLKNDISFHPLTTTEFYFTYFEH